MGRRESIISGRSRKVRFMIDSGLGFISLFSLMHPHPFCISERFIVAREKACQSGTHARKNSEGFYV